MTKLRYRVCKFQSWGKSLMCHVICLDLLLENMVIHPCSSKLEGRTLRIWRLNRENKYQRGEERNMPFPE